MVASARRLIEYGLGLDVGSTSLGWCVLNLKDGTVVGIENMGVRIYSDGRNDKDKEPLAVTRRGARGGRRRNDRLQQRKKDLLKLLRKNDLSPQIVDSEDIYQLRADAAEKKLESHQLGRVLLNLCQRRGFKSNRKSDKKNDDKGAMKTSIAELKQQINEKGAKTLGQYLNLLKIEDKKTCQRVKATVVKGKNQYNFYPSRDMYEQEVDCILEKQGLPEELNHKIKTIIFYQRPLKAQEVGACLFEDGERRAAKASPYFQKFRYLQQLNNLEIIDFDNGECLSNEQREKIKQLQSMSKNVEFKTIRKKLNIDFSFNLEDERNCCLIGDEAAAALGAKKGFASLWSGFSIDEQSEVVERLENTENEDELASWLAEKYNLLPENIDYIINANLPEGYGNLSAKAIKKLLPFLEQGMRYDEACVQAGYNHSDFEMKQVDVLPYYGEVLAKEVIGGSLKSEDKNFPEKYWGKINNPTVHIGLNQIRAVVNEIVKEYGKPSEIVVELARDLNLSKEERSKINKEQNANTKENEIINKELRETYGVKESYENRMIYKLWQDLSSDSLKRCCPFCGKQIEQEILFSGDFEIEHLLPFSRSFNDSRANKVLSCRGCNREKANRTPFEAFAADGEKWNNILARIAELPKNKQWRFHENAMESAKGKEESILARMLNDTRYLATSAKKYLSAICPKNKVRAIPGGLTAIMRNVWGLNNLIGEDNHKDRSDHRHHAIDAFTVACTSVSTLQNISKNSEVAYKEKHKLFSGEQVPFDGYNRKEIENLVNNMIIAHKPDHGDAMNAARQGKTIGALHDDTNYGFIRMDGNDGIFAVRKPISSIFEDKKIAEIADERIRSGLQSLLEDKDDNKERQQIVADYAASKGIRTLRCHIKKSIDSMIPIYKKSDKEKKEKPYRYVASGNNYCAEVYMPNRGKNAGIWCVEIISNFAVHQKDFAPQWKKDEPEAKLIMRLFIDDMVAYDKDGERVICRVKKLTKPNKIYFRPHNIAKEEADKLSWAAYPSGLQERNVRKIKVTPIGRVFDSKA